MKTQQSYTLESFAFFKMVFAAKTGPRNDPDWKKRVHSHEPVIEELYKKYKIEFDRNQLESLAAHGFDDAAKADLEKLYSYNSKKFQELKTSLTTTALNRIISTCQNCTIGEISSFDHYVPKTEFPEFSVNPLNLFPSCAACNQHKSVAWRTNGQRNFLNLYLDHLPIEQYLFADITIDLGSKVITTKFRLDDGLLTDKRPFALIKRHYTGLELLKRFNENSDGVVTELANSLKAHVNHLPSATITAITKEKILLDKQSFGQNYWKAILQDSLMDHPEFLSNILTLIE